MTGSSSSGGETGATSAAAGAFTGGIATGGVSTITGGASGGAESGGATATSVGGQTSGGTAIGGTTAGGRTTGTATGGTATGGSSLGGSPVGVAKDGEVLLTSAGLTIVSYGGFLNGESFQAILPDLRIAAASAASSFATWTVLTSADSGRFFSDPLIDTARLATEDKLTVFYPQKSSSNITVLDYTVK